MKEKAHDLFLLMGQLFQIKNSEKVISIFIESTNQLFDQIHLSRNKDNKHPVLLKIEHKNRIFCHLYASMNPSELMPELSAIFYNAVQMIGMILAKLEYEQLLSDEAIEYQNNLETLINNNPDIIIFKDDQNRWIKANPAALRLCQLEKVDYHYKTDLELSDYLPKKLKNLLNVFNKSDQKLWDAKAPVRYTENIKPNNNSSIILDIIKVPLFQKNARKGLVIIGRDITKLAKTEARLQKSEKKYRGYINNSPVAIFLADEKGHYLEVNEAAAELLGYTKEELCRMKISDLAANNHIETFEKLKKEGNIRHDAVLSHKSGKKITVDLSAVKLSDYRYLSFCLDITEKKELESRLQQSQKLESVGNLTAGVAHDFNNLLTVIMGNADILKHKFYDDPFLKELSTDILSASEKASELTEKMLLFSRKQPLEYIVFNLNDCINNLIKILQRMIGENIIILTELSPDLSLVKADKNNIEQVILNLASNARDAMPTGGTIMIKTKNVHLTKYDVTKIKYSSPGDYVMLSMEDTGAGIDPSFIEKIYDPFFTTKEVGKGTGMGLSVVYGIVKKHKGWINVYSEKNMGTVFRIYLPATEKKQSNWVQQDKLEKNIDNNRSENILLIEDDPAVLKFGKRVLTASGFSTDVAKTGEEARKLFHQNPKAYDLVISDIILPDTNGVDLVHELQRKWTNSKFLFISGYAGKNNSQIKRIKGQAFLSKPFTKDELMTKVLKNLE